MQSTYQNQQKLLNRISLNQKEKISKKKIFKSKIKEIKEILCDSILDRNEKMEEIKINLYNPRNNLLKPKEDNYKPIRIGNLLVATTSTIKVME